MLLLMVVAGCSAGRESKTEAVKTYDIHGRVLEVDAPKQQILLEHAEVPGFMDAMTMQYKVADPAAVGELHANDQIAAKLAVSDHGAELRDVVITAQAAPNTLPKVQYHVPEKGDAVPDFALVNQSGRKIHLGQYRGKVLLLTFIYTRCPLDDFCPRMSRNFAEIDKKLLEDPALYARTHLLSVSFDTAYDKPGVLKSYGAAYTGNYSKELFRHWEFAAPDEETLEKMKQFFDLGVTGSDPKTMVHSLSTVVIGPDGRVVEWLPTNDWKPADVVAEMGKAARDGAPAKAAAAGSGR